MFQAYKLTQSAKKQNMDIYQPMNISRLQRNSTWLPKASTFSARFRESSLGESSLRESSLREKAACPLSKSLLSKSLLSKSLVSVM